MAWWGKREETDENAWKKGGAGYSQYSFLRASVAKNACMSRITSLHGGNNSWKLKLNRAGRRAPRCCGESGEKILPIARHISEVKIFKCRHNDAICMQPRSRKTAAWNKPCRSNLKKLFGILYTRRYERVTHTRAHTHIHTYILYAGSSKFNGFEVRSTSTPNWQFSPTNPNRDYRSRSAWRNWDRESREIEIAVARDQDIAGRAVRIGNNKNELGSEKRQLKSADLRSGSLGADIFIFRLSLFFFFSLYLPLLSVAIRDTMESRPVSSGLDLCYARTAIDCTDTIVVARNNRDKWYNST